MYLALSLNILLSTPLVCCQCRVGARVNQVGATTSHMGARTSQVGARTKVVLELDLAELDCAWCM